MLKVRTMKSYELEETLQLIRSVFLEYEAPDYSAQGTQTFMEFSQQSNIEQGIDDGDLQFWVCCDEKKIIGTIAMKNETHVCMLFVDKNYFRQGIATRLLHAALEGVENSKSITVNSSPYGAPFYRAAGFKDTDKLKTQDGIKFISMSAKCGELKR